MSSAEENNFYDKELSLNRHLSKGSVHNRKKEAQNHVIREFQIKKKKKTM